MKLKHILLIALFLITSLQLFSQTEDIKTRDGNGTRGVLMIYKNAAGSYVYFRPDSNTTTDALDSLILLGNYQIDSLGVIIGHLDGVEASLTAIDSNTDRNTTGGGGEVSATTSGTAFGAQAIKYVRIENNNSSGIAQWGFDSDCDMWLQPHSYVVIQTDNLSDIYYKSQSGTVTLDYQWQN